MKQETIYTKAARAMLACIENHGGLDNFTEKLHGYPEQYLLDLAIAAIDSVSDDLCDHAGGPN